MRFSNQKLFKEPGLYFVLLLFYLTPIVSTAEFELGLKLEFL